eukprot:TRINITY_DN5748_c0_g1_i4.p1 TRINITY_DN5748_c0_g1~~TRINITY_DN5748_c0_g1_i4.p1  ORF type:complete len:1000 (+),score=185.87 TRINITY_DN5748_c0_g1_i4:72-3071(+)
MSLLSEPTTSTSPLTSPFKNNSTPTTPSKDTMEIDSVPALVLPPSKERTSRVQELRKQFEDLSATPTTPTPPNNTNQTKPKPKLKSPRGGGSYSPNTYARDHPEFSYIRTKSGNTPRAATCDEIAIDTKFTRIHLSLDKIELQAPKSPPKDIRPLFSTNDIHPLSATYTPPSTSDSLLSSSVSDPPFQVSLDLSEMNSSSSSSGGKKLFSGRARSAKNLGTNSIRIGKFQDLRQTPEDKECELDVPSPHTPKSPKGPKSPHTPKTPKSVKRVQTSDTKSAKLKKRSKVQDLGNEILPTWYYNEVFPFEPMVSIILENSFKEIGKGVVPLKLPPFTLSSEVPKEDLIMNDCSMDFEQWELRDITEDVTVPVKRIGEKDTMLINKKISIVFQPFTHQIHFKVDQILKYTIYHYLLKLNLEPVPTEATDGTKSIDKNLKLSQLAVDTIVITPKRSQVTSFSSPAASPKPRINRSTTETSSRQLLKKVGSKEPEQTETTPKHQQTKSELPKSEPLKSEPLKSESLKSEPLKSEPTRPETPLPPTPKPSESKPQLVKMQEPQKNGNLDIKTEEEFNIAYNHYEINVDFKLWCDTRNYIAYEILTTEATYVKLLQICLLVYVSAIEKWAGENAVKDFDKFFQILKHIVNVNETLLNDLRERFKNWNDKTQIGDKLFAIAPFLKMYRSYAESYDSVIETIEYYKSKRPNKQFINLLWAGETHPIAKHNNIKSMLILPIQRVPRYVLLLNDLLKNTPTDHPDYNNLVSCTDVMKEVAQQINTAIAQAESRNNCIRIQESFETKFGSKSLPITTLVEAHRIFIKEGTLLKQCRSERKQRIFYLFNDLLIYAHFSGPPPGKLVVDHTFKLETTSTNDLLTESGFAFQIKGQGKSFTVYAESPEQKQEWLHILSETIKKQKEHFQRLHNIEETENSKLNPEPAAVWVPDDQVILCQVCQTEFNLIRRRHHCRNCGKIICGDCSKSRRIVQSVKKDKEVRVCDECQKQLLQ